MRLVNIEKRGEAPVYVDGDQVEAICSSGEINPDIRDEQTHAVGLSSRTAVTMRSGRVWFSRRPTDQVAKIVGTEATANA